MSYCLSCEIIWGKCLFFETLNASCHIDDNSTKKFSLHKRQHGLSINRLVIHINHLGNVITNQSSSGVYYVRNSSGVYYVRNSYQFCGTDLSFPKVFRLRLHSTFWNQHWDCLHYCLQCYHRNIVLCR